MKPSILAKVIICVFALSGPAFGQAQISGGGGSFGGGFAPSGITAVVGNFTAVSQSVSFTPLAGRGFNISGRGTFVATMQLERSFDAGANWHPITAAGTQLYLWTAPFSEQAQEDQVGVLYRLNCTAFTSGTASYRISQ